jgi:hypothetical protein
MPTYDQSKLYGSENWIRNPVKIVYNGGKIRRIIQEVNLINAHYMHVWKDHNETPLHN